MNQKTVKDQVDQIIRDASWKGSAIVGIVFLLLFILLSSIIFSLVLFLCKIALLIGGVVLLGRAVWLAFPMLLEKYKNR